jgi:hypothetical protein
MHVAIRAPSSSFRQTSNHDRGFAVRPSDEPLDELPDDELPDEDADGVDDGDDEPLGRWCAVPPVDPPVG